MSDMLHLGLISLHVTSNLVWIGSIVCTGWLVHRAAIAENDAAGASAGELAVVLYQKVASPAFWFSFSLGLLAVILNPTYYMRLHWFHGKFTAALIVIALHHVIGARAKRAMRGSRQAGRAGGILSIALLAASLLTVVFAVCKGALVP